MLIVYLNEKNPNAEEAAPIVIEDAEMEKDVRFALQALMRMDHERREQVGRFAWLFVKDK